MENNLIEKEIRQLRDSGTTWDEIQDLLVRKKNMDEKEVQRIIMILKKEYHDENMKSGKTKMIIGILLLGTSFIITCINFHADQSFTAVMYGFTSVGIVLLGWGAYDILH